MTVIIQIFLIVFFPAISFGQTIGLFQVTDTILTTSERTRIEAMRKKSIFYEDEQYLVTRSCSGEWGGTVKFKNKKTGIEYSCEVTCPVSVNKLGNGYFRNQFPCTPEWLRTGPGDNKSGLDESISNATPKSEKREERVSLCRRRSVQIDPRLEGTFGQQWYFDARKFSF